MFKPTSLTYGIEWQLLKAQEHYDKYAQIVAKLDINNVRVCHRSGVPYTPEELRKAYEQDPYLNNIPLCYWDTAGYWLVGKRNPLDSRLGFSMSDAVCILKHVVMHIVLAEPRPFLTPEALEYYKACGNEYKACGPANKENEHYQNGCTIPYVSWYGDKQD